MSKFEEPPKLQEEETEEATVIEGTPTGRSKTEKFSLSPKDDRKKEERDAIREGVWQEYRDLFRKAKDIIEGEELESEKDIVGVVLDLLKKEKIEDTKKREIFSEEVVKMVWEKATEELMDAFADADLGSESSPEEHEQLSKKMLEIDKRYDYGKLFDELDLPEEMGRIFNL